MRATRDRAHDIDRVLPPGVWFWPTVYALAGADPLYERSVVRLARARFGPQGVRTVASGEYGLTCDAALITDAQGRRFIGVRAGLDVPRVRCLIGHELAEDRCTQIGYREADREVVCNAQARAILAPCVALAAVAATHAGGLRELAAHFGMPDVQMALRLGEVEGGPSIAVRLSSGRLVVRDARGRLPVQLELRRLFDRGGDALHVLLDADAPANTQVLMRRAED